jgi:hypothetical protein
MAYESSRHSLPQQLRESILELVVRAGCKTSIKGFACQQLSWKNHQAGRRTNGTVMFEAQTFIRRWPAVPKHSEQVQNVVE